MKWVIKNILEGLDATSFGSTIDVTQSCPSRADQIPPPNQHPRATPWQSCPVTPTFLSCQYNDVLQKKELDVTLGRRMELELEYNSYIRVSFGRNGIPER